MIPINPPQASSGGLPGTYYGTPGSMASIIVLMGLCYLTGCATPERAHVLPNREATIGITKEALRHCAGQPIREEAQNQSVIFRYYKEAPMMEESFPGTKGSFPRPHHGCWAHVLLDGDRVTDIGYRSVPPSIDAFDHCEAIFETCHP